MEQLDSLAQLRGRIDGAYRGELCERLGAVLDRPIRQLSKGNRQKLGLVQAFMHRPDLVVLDEPTSGLDPLLQAEVRALLRETAEDGRIHDPGGVELPADIYKVVFHPRSPFFRGIEVEVELADGHYHVPLLLSPYACAIYRGS